MSRRIALAHVFFGLLTTAILGGCKHDSVGTVDLYTSAATLEGTADVVLAIKSFELGGDGGQIDINPNAPAPLTVDLDGGRQAILTGIQVPAGYYKWVRLDIDEADSYVITPSGDRFALKVPSVFQSDGLFLAGQGQITDVVVDVDLHQALSFQVQDGIRVYTLKPVSRLVDLQTVGSILGVVPPDTLVGNLSLGDSRCNPELYVYAGSDVVPEGYSVAVPGGIAPFSSAPLSVKAGELSYTAEVQLLPQGTYTATVTCAAQDVAGSKSIEFTFSEIVKVKAGLTSRVVFGD